MVKDVLIGIHVDESPEKLHAAVRQIETATREPYRLVVLDDGTGQNLLNGLTSRLQISSTPDRQGAAACFNRLISQRAELYVFLENGVLPGPDWLTLLIEALEADPANGLAGPSTNRAWNAQAAVRGRLPEPVTETARYLATRHGAGARTLEPRYSLSDFCYAVTAETVAAVGAADTGYATGPCWEMDYNIRAERAGFRGVWAMGAYVYRSPISPTRARDEALLLAINKRRYQSKFCGLDLAGSRTEFSDDCRGEDCPHFAPAARIEINLPREAVQDREGRGPVQEPFSPLVSCVMPTRNRPEFTARAIEYFQAQDYPNRELIIVYEQDCDLPKSLPHDESVRLVKIAVGASTGRKRSEGNRHARGEFIAQWDDDDWYAAKRLSQQIAPLLSDFADISGLFGTLFFELDGLQFWQCTPALFDQIFYQNVAAGTLVYRKSIWSPKCDYPDTRLREDAVFLTRALEEGARLCRINGLDLFIYLRHGKNSWRFQTGRFHLPEAWTKVATPEWIKPNLSFYLDRSKRVPPISGPTGGKTARPRVFPSVSCIMPTADRPDLIPYALRLFRQQDYPNRELIVIDDGHASVEHLIPNDRRIRYFRVQPGRSLGEKRNLACERADGRLIVHWDDDDWIASDWLRLQVACLTDHDADLCGMDQVFFYHDLLRKAWRYVYPADERPWLCGGTLCYAKDFWARNRFLPVNIGEDTGFVWQAADATFAKHDQIDRYIARVHARNTSPKKTDGARWRTWSAKEVETMIYRIDPLFQPRILTKTITAPSHGRGSLNLHPTWSLS